MRKTYTILTLNNSWFSISQQFLQLLNVYSIERDDKRGRRRGGGKLNVYQNRRECDKLTISRKIIIVTFIVINSKMKFLHKTKMKNPNFHLFWRSVGLIQSLNHRRSLNSNPAAIPNILRPKRVRLYKPLGPSVRMTCSSSGIDSLKVGRTPATCPCILNLASS